MAFNCQCTLCIEKVFREAGAFLDIPKPYWKERLQTLFNEILAGCISTGRIMVILSLTNFLKQNYPNYTKDIEMVLAFYLASLSSDKKYDGSGFSIIGTAVRGIGQFVMMIIDCLNIF